MNDAAPPQPKMPGWKKALAYSIAVPADILKFLFATFVFSAPFFAATAVNLYLTAKEWPSWAVSLATAVTGVGTAAVELAATPITSALAVFGVIMASMIAVAAWLILSLVFVLSGINPFAPRYFWKTSLGWFGSVVPFFNFIPTITPAVWLIVRDASRADRAAKAAWETQQSEERTRIMRGREAQLHAYAAAHRAANDARAIPEENDEAA